MSGAAHIRLSRWQVFSQSWPIMIANAAAPVVGLVDTFVIGRFTNTLALAGIGLGAVIYSVVYWGFGFLRMSTAGLAAQSEGAGDSGAVVSHLLRAVPIGLFIGLFVLITHPLWIVGAFKIYTADSAIETAAATYIQARLWGLPATLGSIALMGWFVGISRSHRALVMQIILNAVNAVLSLLFVIQFEWGLYGVGLASSAAEWVGLLSGLVLAWGAIQRRGGLDRKLLTRANLLRKTDLQKLGVTNGNIFIRTMALTFGFNFFGNAAATEGTIFLAANHIHLQFITMSALVLDAFAHTAEAVTGAAYGARNRKRLDRAVRLTTEFSCIFACVCGALIFLGGPFLIDLMTPDPAVRETGRVFLIYCALAPVLGFAAYQLDGIFIGTTKTKEMRNAQLLSLLIYLTAHFALQPRLGGHGIWIAFLVFYVARAVTLGSFYGRVRAETATSAHPRQ